MKPPFKGARILKETEVPQPGDFCRWSESKRDDWHAIPTTDTMRSGLPRSKPGVFRGSDGLDWDRVTAA